MGKRGAGSSEAATKGAAKGTADNAVVIRDVQTLKALADPLRHELLALLDSPRTVRELADHIGRAPDRLYYHLGLLERRGLITAIEERGAERRYKLAAEHIQIDPDLTMPPGVAAGIIGSILQRTHREVAAASRLPKHAGKKRTTFALQHLRITEADRVELAERLVGLIHEFEAREANEGDTIGVLVGVWPVAE